MIMPLGFKSAFALAFVACALEILAGMWIRGGLWAWLGHVTVSLFCLYGLIMVLVGAMTDSPWHGEERPMGLGLLLGAGAGTVGSALVMGVLA